MRLSKDWVDFIRRMGPKVIETHHRVCREVKGPLLGLSLPGDLTTKEIEGFGYKIYCYPQESHWAAVAAMLEVMTELKEKGTTTGYFDRHPKVDAGIYGEMVRTAGWLELEKKYTP